MIKINSINKEDLIHYFTARIDIKNSGEFKNQMEFLFISDEKAILSYPDWFKHDDGIGVVIHSSKMVLDLKIKCIKKGSLNLRLRGMHARGPEGRTIPLFIEYNKVLANGVNLINGDVLVTHDDFHKCHFAVEDGDIVFLHIEWSPFQLKQ